MKLTLTTLAATLAFATSTTAVSDQLINNYCTEDIFLTIYTPGDGTNSVTNGPFQLPGNQAWIGNITGRGNTATVSKNANIWVDETSKLILGTSVDLGILYW